MTKNATRIIGHVLPLLWLSLLYLCAHAQTSAPVQSTLDLPGGKIVYRDSGGKGMPIVFLLAGNLSVWEHQAAAIPQAGYRFIAIDYRGLGARPGTDSLKTVAGIDELLTGSA